MSKRLLLLYIILVCNTTIYSQTKGDTWHLEFDKAPNWSEIDKKIHTLYYYDNEFLIAYDYLNNNELWKVALKDYKNSEFIFTQDKPFLKITDQKAFTTNNRSKKAIVINRFSGEVLFNTNAVEEFNNSSVYYSKDHNYVLLFRKEVVKKDKKNNIKRHVNWYLTLVKMENSKSLWTVKLPPKENGILGRNFEHGPIASDQTVMFSFDGALVGYSIEDGTLIWKKNILSEKISTLNISDKSTRNKGFLAIYKSKNKSTFPMNYLSIDTGEALWEEDFDLGHYYNITFGPNQIIVRCANGFNYIDYDGKKQWPNNAPVTGKIEKIYAQDNGHLIISSVDNKLFANWLNEDLSYVFDTPKPVSSKHIIEGIKLDDYLILIEPFAIYTFDLSTKQRIARIPFREKFNYTIDKNAKTIVYTKSGKNEQPFILNFKAEKPNAFLDQISFTKKNDSVMRIETSNNKFSFISRNELIKYDANGTEIKRLYYPPKFNSLKTIASIGAIAFGTIFAEETSRINGEIYKAGLKDLNNLADEMTTVYLFNELGSPQLGMGFVAGATVNNFLNQFERNTTYNPYNKIDNLWMHRSQLDSGKWGLRIIDIENTEELHQFEMGKDKNFEYTVDAFSQVIISSSDKEIIFNKF
ncbi:PQQ-binding-like beta-propeller repeat protein [Winogradskyella eckloniae]|uniref:outer membrane protein assembly factor BamB family protein n=1 Tax=Winogradskyella eckloniae TaxID=1089306 RepID=UPI00156725A2|nr:PQQ-binding-like beta-propeller repeat protein [Winogradskyella eckloniae]NRD20270.1 PQQ-binding-like beta-propeller repeat protein [Winogradskyella eckloniae]